ncbi:MAG: tetratricopeptide repeat protein [Legionellales bacterium]
MIDQNLQETIEKHLGFLSQDEHNLNLLLEITSLYRQIGDLDSAQIHMDKANALDREACLVHQGLLYIKKSQVALAKECFIEALSLADVPAIRYNLGLCYYLSYEFEQSYTVMAPLLDEERQHPEAMLLIARILHRQDSLLEAVTLIQKVLAQNSQNAEALGFLSLLYYDLGEALLAKDTCLEALELSPDNYDAQLIHILSKLATKDSSIEDIEALLHINPKDPRLWFALGTTYTAKGDFDSAECTFKKAIELFPDFYDCYIALGWCLLIKNDLDEAEEIYELALQVEAELAEAWGGLALVSALREEFWKIDPLIEKAEQFSTQCFLCDMALSLYDYKKNPEKYSCNPFPRQGRPI